MVGYIRKYIVKVNFCASITNKAECSSVVNQPIPIFTGSLYPLVKHDGQQLFLVVWLLLNWHLTYTNVEKREKDKKLSSLYTLW